MSAVVKAAIAAIIKEQTVVTTPQVLKALTDHFGPSHFVTQKRAAMILRELGWKVSWGRQLNSTAIARFWRAPPEVRT